MDDWEKTNEPALLEKEDFYIHLSMEDFTDADSTRKNGLLMILKYDLNTIICMFKVIHYCQLIYLATFRICIEIYGLDAAQFLSITGLAWQATSEKTKVKLDLLTDIDMFLLVEKGIGGGTCHTIN